MFTLVLVEDDIPIKPCFLVDWEAELKREIQSKYTDRVIPSVGLCVEFYEFVKIKDAPVYPGGGGLSCGEAVFKVEFHLIVFQPQIGEWIVGSIVGSTTAGLRVSLGFYHDITIPPSGMREPYVYDSHHKQWAWQYKDYEARTVENLWYRYGELVRFRVTSVVFPETVGPGGTQKISAMQIVGAVDKDGLGCVTWWPNDYLPGKEDPPQEFPAAADAQRPEVLPLADAAPTTETAKQ